MSEHDHQKAVFQWAGLNERTHPELSLLFAVPNGSYKGKASAGRFKAEGLKSGVPDVCLPVAKGKFNCLFIEMKDGNRPLSENQILWLEKLDRFGACAVVCRNVDEAINILEWYLRGAA
jgi:hypothetical protein